MTPELRLQMDRQKTLVRELLIGSYECEVRGCSNGDCPACMQIALLNKIIAELRVQLKDAQDLVTVEPDFPLPMPSWLNDEPTDDNGDYARGIRP